MLRSNNFLLILASIVVFGACSDATTDPHLPNNDEFEVAISNPTPGATLEGETPVIIEGNMPHVVGELQLYVGDQQVKTVQNPSLPHEFTLETHNYTNSDRELRAELVLSDPDTTVKSSVSTSFENYLVTLDTENILEDYQNNYEKAYIFISDPSGEVLKKIDIMQVSDGELEYFPPGSTTAEDAPSYYNLTLAFVWSLNGQQRVTLDTDFGRESWGTVAMNAPAASSNGSSGTKDVTIELDGFGSQPFTTFFATENSWDSKVHSSSDPVSFSLTYPEQDDNLIISHLPGPTTGRAPLYHWEENMQDLNDGVTLTYDDVINDFTSMGAHDVSLAGTSGIDIHSYQYLMSAQEDSWENGYYSFGYFPGEYDANPNAPLGMYVPNIDNRLFDTFIVAADQSHNNTYYEQHTIGDFPDRFEQLDAQASFSNISLDELQMELSGTMDYAYLEAEVLTESYAHYWGVSVPDTLENFTFPKIGNSLNGEISNFNRSNFSIIQVTMWDYDNLEGYQHLLDVEHQYTMNGDIFSDFSNKYRLLNTASKSSGTGHQQISNTGAGHFGSTIEAILNTREKRQLRGHSEIPVHLKRRMF